jgi:hypothetical protein
MSAGTRGVGDLDRVDDAVDRDLRAVLRPLVHQPVVVVLDGDGGQLLAGRSELVHVSDRHHGVQAREGDAAASLPLHVRRRGEGIRRFAATDVGHLLHAAGEHDVVHAGGHVHEGHAEGEAARRARGLDPRARDVGLAQVVRHDRSQVLLRGEEAGAHAPDVHRLQGVNACVVHGQQRGLDEDLTIGLRPKLAPLLHADADYGYVSHGVLFL